MIDWWIVLSAGRALASSLALSALASSPLAAASGFGLSSAWAGTVDAASSAAAPAASQRDFIEIMEGPLCFSPLRSLLQHTQKAAMATLQKVHAPERQTVHSLLPLAS
ncbi:MAG: hypothetical protein WDN06_03440 [Asticcacaulis sp.]